MNKVYVLYASDTYFDIVSVCAKSIRTFSDIPIIVYMLNSDKKVDVKNTKSVRWNCNIDEFSDEGMYHTPNPENNFYINRSHSKVYNLLIQRPLITKHALENFADVVAYVDSDSIATPHIDSIFSYYDTNSLYPYFTEGIFEWMLVNGRGGATNMNDLSTTLEHPICDLFNINQYVRQKYIQTGYFVAGQNTIDFLEEWYWMCINPKVLKNFQLYAPFHEETVANALLWKYKYHNSLPYIYSNGSLKEIDRVYSEVIFNNRKQNIEGWLTVPAKKDQLFFFHGEKRPEIMENMIEKIKSYNNIIEKKKILFIAPHMSTGGLPQYLLKKIQFLLKEYDVYVVEYNCVSSDYVVQREQLQKLLKNKYFTLWEDKLELLSIIDMIQPYVIHLEEIPEMFMDDNLAVSIYGDKNRNYFIVESTHSSYTNPNEFRFYPDKFILASKWSQEKFTNILPHIPNELWEYPIEDLPKYTEIARKKLDFISSSKHVLMVGLFTEGKNQGEIFEIAKQLPEIQFHFVGNQAPNFAEYWGPLMESKPDNCIIWGERNDTHLFYQACDLFYFSSKLELNPLSIKEALSYNLPCLFRRLETYMDSYDNNSLVTYIDNDLDKTKQKLLEKLCITI
jgi:hypothetical protein